MSEIRLMVTENVLNDPSKVTLEMYRDYLDRDGRAWVAELDRTLIGFSYAAHHDNSIWALFVNPQYEGLGAGKQLLQLACDYLFAHGAKSVRLSTTVGTRADRFYQALGWQRLHRAGEQEAQFELQRSD
ncbi:MAG: GNAT family N-acetyltransferase [Burkholderiaceae bacterium]|nr:MAG: GNAT family N-acetyltransferase [Burkholderiaceae bacterium]